MKKLNITFATVLVVLGCFAMGSVLSASASTPTPVPVTITGVYDFSTFPNVTGTFTTSGPLQFQGLLQWPLALIMMVFALIAWLR